LNAPVPEKRSPEIPLLIIDCRKFGNNNFQLTEREIQNLINRGQDDIIEVLRGHNISHLYFVKKAK
jgi:hypothetical protein